MKPEAGAAAASSPAAAVVARSPEQAAPTQAPETPSQPQSADLRLVIEEDPVTGAFVYKTLDRRTGEVILQLPRAEVLKAMSTGDYDPGDLIKTRV
ncbi:MAG: hypothetical protein KY446_06505 [Proteobacteria bacterium]|nr:hypothetical protein [Pseudomonadota bacterium]